MYTQSSLWSIFCIFLKLGLTSFGGPIAHLAYFRETFVQRHKWLDEQSYSDLLALCQFLPGPASSQVGIAVGLMRGGYRGALAAWLGFTLPSALFLAICAWLVTSDGVALPEGTLHSFKVVAVAIVAQAVWGMAKNLCRTLPTVAIMLLSACLVLWSNTVWAQIGVIVMSALLGVMFFKPNQIDRPQMTSTPFINKRTGVKWLAVFFALLLCLPLAAAVFPNKALLVFDSFYRTGSLVFGGGHVILPLLQAETVQSAWVTQDVFVTGYGLTQAVPGPLFTFAAFLGASMTDLGAWGAWLALVAIFMPSFLLVFGVMPFWQSLRRHQGTQGAMMAVNAAVVGILLAAFYNPVWSSAIFQVSDGLFALMAFVALAIWRLPPWLVVVASGLLGALLF